METDKDATANTGVSGDGAHTSTCQPNSRHFDAPSKDLSASWPIPASVMEFAAQANRVATQVLNGEIDKETARTYSTLARVVAQAASIEVTRARFLKEAPDLSLEDGWHKSPASPDEQRAIRENEICR